MACANSLFHTGAGMANDECLMTNDERMTNDEARRMKQAPPSSFVISDSSFFRHSSLGIRHSDPPYDLHLLRPSIPTSAISCRAGPAGRRGGPGPGAVRPGAGCPSP